MTAIAFDLPESIAEVRDGIRNFALQEVIPRHEKNRELLENPRLKYEEDGRLSAPVRELIKEIRMASARAGYYQMCVPEALGGSGLGMQAYYVCWEELFHTCGPHNWMMLYALSHWAFGPSRLLEKVTDRAREEILEPLMSGEKSMCFGLSEPGAGSDASIRSASASPPAKSPACSAALAACMLSSSLAMGPAYNARRRRQARHGPAPAAVVCTCVSINNRRKRASRP
jgi:acyl-CoA dehydrogenase